jgi:uncharacterized protein YbjT (DUF2867 family)
MTNELLVVGATGVVGRNVLRHFEALPAWNLTGLSRRPRAVRWSSAVSYPFAGALGSRGGTVDAPECLAVLSDNLKRAAGASGLPIQQHAMSGERLR